MTANKKTKEPTNYILHIDETSSVVDGKIKLHYMVWVNNEPLGHFTFEETQQLLRLLLLGREALQRPERLWQ